MPAFRVSGQAGMRMVEAAYLMPRLENRLLKRAT